MLFILASLGPLLVFYGVVKFYPLALGFMASLSDWNLSVKVMTFIGFRNYASLLTDPAFLNAFVNTLWFVLYTIPGTVFISLFIAILINKLMQKKLRTIFSTLYFIPMVTSMVALTMIWKWLYHPMYGLINYFLSFLGVPYIVWLQNPKLVILAIAIMTTWRSIGFYAVIFLAGLQGIPTMYYEAANIDGASGWHQFRHITLPLLVYTLAFVTVMVTIASFMVFTQVYIMTKGGPGTSSEVMALRIYKTGIEYLDIGRGSAMAYVLFGTIFLGAYLQMKNLTAKWKY